MATSDSLVFVEPPPDDVSCPVCMTVMRNPHLLSCCGHHVCRDCVSEIERDRKPCPLCRVGFTSLLDKGFQRKIDELKVLCPHHELGCEWMGELSKSEKHLNPAEADGDFGCEFQEIPCGNGCGGHIRRRSLREHENSECPLRPSECEYCGIYRGTYIDLQHHWSGCERYPVPCPHQCCSGTWPRCEVKNHLQNECPLEVVGCDYGLAGCSVRRAREDMPIHMKTQGDFHSSLLLKQNVELQRRLEEQVTQMQQLTKQFQKISSDFENGCQRMTSLVAENQDLKAEVTQLRQNLGDENQVLKDEITQLKQEQQEQKEEQQALLKQLLEEKEIVRQQGTASAALEREIVRQSELREKERQTLTSQVQSLGKQQQTVTDGLQQKIQALKQDVCLVETCITPTPPFPFTVGRYNDRMTKKEVFISSPFYTHRRGYKMSIRVDVNDGSDHVLVYCCIMHGEHDDNLQWPFHGDVYIRLLNSTDSQNHFEKLIRYDKLTLPRRAEKVTIGDRGYLHGHKFIAHEDVKSSKYHEGDALDFEVTRVIVANSV